MLVVRQIHRNHDIRVSLSGFFKGAATIGLAVTLGGHFYYRGSIQEEGKNLL